jgi:lipopolysaccharide/colanic/teichoic acid biosynthesis glycosyltransferase
MAFSTASNSSDSEPHAKHPEQKSAGVFSRGNFALELFPPTLTQNSSRNTVDQDTQITPSTSERLSMVCYEVSKRFLDIFFSLTLLTFVFPIMVVLSVLIRCSSPGPAIYCQRRLTDGDKTFTIFKFRTMSTDAERASGAVWAADKDPRITPLGHFMRKTRLDELPQLLNVVIGDMSLVGPRPERPEFARELEQKFPSFSKRTQVKAGLTGLAQISSGYAASVDSYKEKLAWDRLYVQRRSFILDLRIMIRTVSVVLRGDGAR